MHLPVARHFPVQPEMTIAARVPLPLGAAAGACDPGVHDVKNGELMVNQWCLIGNSWFFGWGKKKCDSFSVFEVT